MYAFLACVFYSCAFIYTSVDHVMEFVLPLAATWFGVSIVACVANRLLTGNRANVFSTVTTTQHIQTATTSPTPPPTPLSKRASLSAIRLAEKIKMLGQHDIDRSAYFDNPACSDCVLRMQFDETESRASLCAAPSAARLVADDDDFTEVAYAQYAVCSRVLRDQSPFMHVVLDKNGSFKESRDKEIVVVMHPLDRRPFHHMLGFAYRKAEDAFRWIRAKSKDSSDDAFVHEVVDLMMIADKYQFDGIFSQCAAELSAIELSVEACEMLVTMPNVVIQSHYDDMDVVFANVVRRMTSGFMDLDRHPERASQMSFTLFHMLLLRDDLVVRSENTLLVCFWYWCKSHVANWTETVALLTALRFEHMTPRFVMDVAMAMSQEEEEPNLARCLNQRILQHQTHHIFLEKSPYYIAYFEKSVTKSQRRQPSAASFTAAQHTFTVTPKYMEASTFSFNLPEKTAISDVQMRTTDSHSFYCDGYPLSVSILLDSGNHLWVRVAPMWHKMCLPVGHVAFPVLRFSVFARAGDAGAAAAAASGDETDQGVTEMASEWRLLHTVVREYDSRQLGACLACPVGRGRTPCYDADAAVVTCCNIKTDTGLVDLVRKAPSVKELTRLRIVGDDGVITVNVRLESAEFVSRLSAYDIDQATLYL